MCCHGDIVTLNLVSTVTSTGSGILTIMNIVNVPCTNTIQYTVCIILCVPTCVQGKKGPVPAPRTWTVGSQFKVRTGLSVTNEV